MANFLHLDNDIIKGFNEPFVSTYNKDQLFFPVRILLNTPSLSNLVVIFILWKVLIIQKIYTVIIKHEFIIY